MGVIGGIGTGTEDKDATKNIINAFDKKRAEKRK